MTGVTGSLRLSTRKAFFKAVSAGSELSFEAKITPGESIKRILLSNSTSCKHLKMVLFKVKNCKLCNSWNCTGIATLSALQTINNAAFADIWKPLSN